MSRGVANMVSIIAFSSSAADRGYAAIHDVGLIATLTPGMYTLAGRSGKDFEFTPASGSIPYAKTLGGMQVLVDGVPAPITSSPLSDWLI